jgi:hypothetical protein
MSLEKQGRRAKGEKSQIASKLKVLFLFTVATLLAGGIWPV